MSFSDLFFLYLFLPICLLIYYRARRLKTRNLILIIFSLIFYSWAKPAWILLLLASCVINWFLGLQISNHKGRDSQKALVAVAIIYNLAMLVVFKYTGFFAENINLLFHTSLPVPNFSQPIGLSFYTFRAISYILDVYWEKSQPQKKFSLFLLYLSFFPHMTAGPITRYNVMEQELSRRKVSAPDLYEGSLRLMVGLAKKVIIADHLITIVNNFFGTGTLSGLSMMGTWYTAIMYTLYVYFDFSGYTDMALGIAKLFGFKLNENFNYPFICKNIQEFWQRWHISLGTFFRDYLLYIPLFGKRRKYASLFLVWFCTGFWHGAAWNYIIWGLYYGCFVFLEEKLGRKRLKAWPTWWKHLYSMLVVIIGQAIYYSVNLRQLGSILLHLTGISMLTEKNAFVDIATWTSLQNNLFLIILAVIACFPIVPKLKAYITASRDDTLYTVAKVGAAVICVGFLVICSIMLVDSTNSPFLYWNY